MRAFANHLFLIGRRGSCRNHSHRYARCLVCGHCGRYLTPITKPSGAQVYRCQTQSSDYPDVAASCDYWTYTRDEDVHAVIEEAVVALAQHANVTSLLDDLPSPENRYRDELAHASGLLEKVMDEERQLARQLIARRVTEDMYDELVEELQQRRARAEDAIAAVEKKLRRLMEEDRRRERLIDARSIGLRILNHPDKSVTNAWAKRTLRVTCWDKSAWQELGLPSRFRVEFI